MRAVGPYGEVGNDLRDGVAAERGVSCHRLTLDDVNRGF
jgi:hypothetical protein